MEFGGLGSGQFGGAGAGHVGGIKLPGGFGSFFDKKEQRNFNAIAQTTCLFTRVLSERGDGRGTLHAPFSRSNR